MPHKSQEVARIQRNAIYVVVGILSVAVVIMGILFDRTLDAQRDRYDKVISTVRQQQFYACERGNHIRKHLAEDNEYTIRTLRDLVRTARPEERPVHLKVLHRRIARRPHLREYPCRTLLSSDKYITEV